MTLRATTASAFSPRGTADPEARINQLGNGNDSSIDQTNVTGSFNLIADNNQNGDDNISTITQGANGPGFTGTLRATVNQTNGADSTVTQDANNGSKNFNATVTQDDSISVVTQTGNASTGTNNPALRAIVNQTGGSDSTIDQTVNGAGGGDLFADVDQANGATATVTQSANGASSVTQDAFVAQDGRERGGDSLRPSTMSVRTPSFIATVDQTGTGNLTAITQQDQGRRRTTATATCSPS